MKLRSFKIHGGKHYLSKFIITNFPSNYSDLIYIEPFGGAANTLLQKVPSKKEIYNDVDLDIAFIIYCLKHHPDHLIKALKEIPYTEESFDKALQHPKLKATGLSFLPELTPFASVNPDYAVAEIVARRMSRGGLKTHFCWSNRLRGGQMGELNSWQTFLAQIPLLADRLKNVEIRSQSAQQIIEEYQDDPEVLFYLDPPYLPRTRSVAKVYVVEMTEQNHIDLATLLHKIKGKVILSGYYSQLYAKIYRGWHMTVKEMPNHASQSKNKERRLECLWMNW